MIIHKNEPDCYEINVQIAQKTLEFVEKYAYNESQYTDIEELRRMSHESFGIKVSEPGTAGCGRDRKSTRLNSSHNRESRMPSSA